jgi:hypothetical protein
MVSILVTYINALYRMARGRFCRLGVIIHALGFVFGLEAREGFGGVVEGVVNALAAEEQAIALFHARMSSPTLGGCRGAVGVRTGTSEEFTRLIILAWPERPCRFRSLD